MSLEQILKYSGGILLLILTFIQITPIKINPWTWIGRCIGKVLNQDLVNEIKTIKKTQQEDKEENEKRFSALETSHLEFREYYKQDDAKSARRRILRSPKINETLFMSDIKSISNNYLETNKITHIILIDKYDVPVQQGYDVYKYAIAFKNKESCVR